MADGVRRRHVQRAAYLARLGERVVFLTAVGADQFSADLLDGWRDEGTDISCVILAPDRLPGLHAVQANEYG